MTNHPNRGHDTTKAGRTPRPAEISAAREQLGLTQAAAGRVIYTSMRAWQNWEQGDRRMHPALWELWLFKAAGRPVPELPTAPTPQARARAAAADGPADPVADHSDF